MEHIREALEDIAPKNLEPALADPSIEQYDCPLCLDFGWLHPLAESGGVDYERLVRCGCRKDEDAAAKAESYMRYCQLPKVLASLTFDNFNKRPGTEEAYDAALQLAEERGLLCLTLVSPVDRGKTHLAVAICRHWIARGKAARYVYVPLLMTELRHGFDDDSYYRRLQFFLNVPLLVLDDLGVEKPSAWVEEQLETIIDYRCMNELPLVVTTNKPVDQLPGDKENRIASRLQRITQSKVVVIEADEYRLYKEK